MPKTDDSARMWRPGGDHAPKITRRPDDPHIIETDRQSDPRQVAAEVADALVAGQKAIVLGRVDGARSMICRTVPLRRGVFVITKDHRGTGLRPNIGAAMADVSRLVTAEYDPNG